MFKENRFIYKAPDAAPKPIGNLNASVEAANQSLSDSKDKTKAESVEEAKSLSRQTLDDSKKLMEMMQKDSKDLIGNTPSVFGKEFDRKMEENEADIIKAEAKEVDHTLLDPKVSRSLTEYFKENKGTQPKPLDMKRAIEQSIAQGKWGRGEMLAWRREAVAQYQKLNTEQLPTAIAGSFNKMKTELAQFVKSDKVEGVLSAIKSKFTNLAKTNGPEVAFVYASVTASKLGKLAEYSKDSSIVQSAFVAEGARVSADKDNNYQLINQMLEQGFI